MCRKIRVLHVMSNLRPSGMERMLVSGAPYMLTAEFEHSIVGIGEEHPYSSVLEDAGYTVHALSAPGRLTRWSALTRVIRSDRPDIVHIHTEGSYLPTVIVARLALGSRGAVVRTVHNVFLARGRWLWSRWLQARIADTLVAAMVAPSPDVAENERGLGRSAQVVYNWVDDAIFELREARQRSKSERIAGSRPVAAIIGNCSETKRHELALAAIEQLGHELIHVGMEDGASLEETARLARMADSGRLIHRGAGGPDRALSEGDYYVMPSRNEGMGVALAEALVCGLPSVVSDSPGLRWARNQPGVISVSDSPAEWARAIEAVAANGEPSQSTIDFSARRGASEYEEVYRAALRGKRGRDTDVGSTIAS